MLTRLMRDRIEDLVLNFTRQELVELTRFLKMAEELRRLDDSALKGLSMVLEDNGNPNMWNLKKLVTHEQRTRERIRLGRMVVDGPGDLPAWKEVFPGKSGTMVPQGEDQDSRTSELYRRTRPQPGDE